MLRSITFLVILSLLLIKGEALSIAIAQESSTDSTPTTAPADTNELAQCHEVPLIFSKCIPSICVEESPFGTIYRQIVSYDQTNNSCLFKERTPGFGGLDCSFKASSLDTVEQLYTKKSLARLDKNISLTEDESLSIQKLNKQYCASLGEHEASIDPIPLNQTSVSTTPEVITKTETITKPKDETSDIREAEEKPADTIDANTEKSVDDPFKSEGESAFSESAGSGFKFKSLMFTASELDLLNQALEAYRSGSTLSIGDSSSGGEEALPTIRSFFLKSIIYYNPDQWSLWIENSLKTEKITDHSNSSGLFVQEIKPDYVTIIWQTPNLDKISPDWKRFLISDSNNRYRNDKYDIVVKSDEQSIAEVTFRLRPNQTFNVNKMKITEGKIQ